MATEKEKEEEEAPLFSDCVGNLHTSSEDETIAALLSRCVFEPEDSVKASIDRREEVHVAAELGSAVGQ